MGQRVAVDELRRGAGAALHRLKLFRLREGDRRRDHAPDPVAVLQGQVVADGRQIGQVSGSGRRPGEEREADREAGDQG